MSGKKFFNENVTLTPEAITNLQKIYDEPNGIKLMAIPFLLSKELSEHIYARTKKSDRADIRETLETFNSLVISDFTNIL